MAEENKETPSQDITITLSVQDQATLALVFDLALKSAGMKLAGGIVDISRKVQEERKKLPTPKPSDGNGVHKKE